jgi:hypothetical protein
LGSSSSSKSEPRDIRALSFITMELMQKYVKEDGAIGVDNIDRWHSNSGIRISFRNDIGPLCGGAAQGILFHPSNPKKLILIVAASTPEPSMAEGVTDRHNLFGPGLYTWALQVYTKRVVSKIAIGVVFESRYLLHCTWLSYMISRLDSHSISSYSISIILFRHTSNSFGLCMRI